MSTEQGRTLTLTSELSELLDSTLSSGDYSDEQDALKAGLLALRDETPLPDMDDEWLKAQVLPVIEKMRKDPSRGRTIEQVRARLAATHAEFLRTH